MNEIFIATMTVLAWWPVASQNCGLWEQGAECVVQDELDEATCGVGVVDEDGDDSTICFMLACMSSVKYCDTLYLGLIPGGQVVWRTETAKEERHRDIEEARRAAESGEGGL